MRQGQSFGDLPRDVQLRIFGRFDMDTRIKLGWVRRLHVPDRVARLLTDKLQKPRGIVRYCWASSKLYMDGAFVVVRLSPDKMYRIAQCSGEYDALQLPFSRSMMHAPRVYEISI